ncbi:MAG: hypothetical protein KR126chlam1_00475 [Chlamydiae bacterium]|nr:hypothetical protein [Chlamydiota bacterium]
MLLASYDLAPYNGTMAKKNIIGRKKELTLLDEIHHSKEAEFLAIYGRRRVGKTHLIQEYFSSKGCYLEITGQKQAPLREQLENFITIFSAQFSNGIPFRTPKSWKEAFALITNQLDHLPKTRKCILFLDELPWLAGPRSGLMQALDYYWNRHWSRYPNFRLIVCGSAASWMLDHLINARGGLHNRITRVILLRPFSLNGAIAFLRHRGINLSIKQFCDLYMVCGGVPYYLKQITKARSAMQNINRICFQKEGILHSEFDRLFSSLFDSSDLHRRIVTFLATHPKGILRKEIINKLEISSGGSLRKRLDELEAAGFIQGYIPYGNKKKFQSYRLVDEYILFYLHWIAPIKQRGLKIGPSYWQTKAQTSAVHAWAGGAFEMICLKHVDEIQKALELEGIHAEIGSWRYVPKKGSRNAGAQIDLLFDREDGIVSLCEIKYSDKKYPITKSYAKELKQKLEVFEAHFPGKKAIALTMITLHGLKPTIWSDELVEDEIVFSALIH